MSEAGAGFPVFGEADWRKTAEAALKGGALDSLISKTADGLRIEPICTPRSGARALRASAGAWMALARMENPDPGAANEAALDDLAQGADGLQVVFAGAMVWPNGTRPPSTRRSPASDSILAPASNSIWACKARRRPLVSPMRWSARKPPPKPAM